jgi:hypothetical protein
VTISNQYVDWSDLITALKWLVDSRVASTLMMMVVVVVVRVVVVVVVVMGSGEWGDAVA